VLSLKYLADNITGASLMDKIKSILDKWNLDGKVKYVVAYNGSNII
jgi:hypothetical protein